MKYTSCVIETECVNVHMNGGVDYKTLNRKKVTLQGTQL